ncbi:hypothetical protein [Streptomyces sp. KL116D]|uniref:hypothetical protein n=1 Tax=Streptomyces sp. KL116D TaxID=3045152 RepID=UPI00355906CB
MSYGDGADGQHPVTSLDIAAHEMTRTESPPPPPDWATTANRRASTKRSAT